MRILPVQPTPNQTMSVILANQNTTLNIYQKFFGLYVDVLVNDVRIIGGVVGRDRNRIVRSDYLEFDGDFTFFDTQGIHDPDYAGLGSRYLFAYLTQDELATYGVQ